MRWYISLFLLTSFTIPASVYAETACRSEVRGHCVKIAETAQALVPGIEFLQIPILGTNKVGPVLLALYVFAMSLVGISALVMLVIAGFWYLTAGDNTGRMGQAKTWMGNAVFGLVLALLSFLILYTLNPDLTNLLDLKLRPVGGMGPGGIGP